MAGQGSKAETTMGQRLDQQKLNRRRAGERSDSHSRWRGAVKAARRDSARTQARERPTVDEMFDDVQALLSRRTGDDDK
jgi:hypothetical protein